MELPQEFYYANIRSFCFGASHFGKTENKILPLRGKKLIFPVWSHTRHTATHNSTLYFSRLVRTAGAAGGFRNRPCSGQSQVANGGWGLVSWCRLRSIVACNCHWSSFAGGSRRRLQSDFSPKRKSKMKVHFVLLSISLSLYCSAEGEDLTLDFFLKC